MILNSSLTGTGRMGNLVGRKGLDGKTYAAIYQPNVSNPKTPAQMEQRAKVALAAKVAGMLGVLGKQVLVANGYSTGRRGKLITQILGKITDGEGYSTPSLLAGLPLVKNPMGAVELSTRQFTFTEPTAQASGSIAYNFSATVPQDETLVRYCVAVMVYNATSGEWRATNRVLDEPGRVAIYIDQSWIDAQVYAYAYVLPVTVSANAGLNASATMGALTGNEKQFSQAIDTDGVIYGNFTYTQVNSLIEAHNFNQA